MSASLSSEGRALRAFRLSEVPINIRTRAAAIASMRSDLALRDDQAGYGGLLAKLAAQPDMHERRALLRAAKHPSDRVYWITAKAWEEVMGADAA
jgi:hypothetical protein